MIRSLRTDQKVSFCKCRIIQYCNFSCKAHIQFCFSAELFISALPILGSESIQFKNGEEGRKRRKATDSAFGHSMLRHFCENFNEVCINFPSQVLSVTETMHYQQKHVNDLLRCYMHGSRFARFQRLQDNVFVAFQKLV